MDKVEFSTKRKELLTEKQVYLNEINKKYTEMLKAYLEANSPVEHLKVYELVSDGKKVKHCSRFVVYDATARFIFDDENPVIEIGGWWLNRDSVPAQWRTYTVDGVATPTIFKLSENQEHKPHPEAEKAK